MLSNNLGALSLYADLDVVVPADLQLEGSLERDVLLLDGLDVNLADHATVRHNLVPEKYTFCNKCVAYQPRLL
jgi:hypothetical protein